MHLSHVFRGARRTARALLSAVLALPMQAFSGMDWDDDSALPIVLSASRLSQNVLSAPNSVTILDRELIEASGATDVAELFRLVPGFLVGNFRGHRPVVTYLGMADQYARRIQVLVDGLSVYTPSVGGVPWQRLPLAIEEIERIEVVRGPSSVTYGSNAFLATVNIITRHASEDRGLALSGSFGSKRLYRTRVRIARSYGPVSLRASAVASGDDGFDGQPDDHNMRSGSLRLDWQASPSDSVQWSFGASAGNFGEGEFGSSIDPPHKAPGTLFYNYLRWLHTRDNGDEWNLRLAFTHDNMDDRVAGTLSGLPTEIDFRLRSNRYDIEGQYTGQLSPTVRYVAGAGLRLDTVNAPGFINRNETQTNWIYRAFANLEWQLAAKTTLNVGNLFEHNTINGLEYAPRLALNHRLGANRSLRLSATRAIRTPRITEEELDLRVPIGPTEDINAISAGNLHAETNTTFEAGYLQRFPTLDLSVDAKLFYSKIDGAVIGSNAGSIFNPFFGEDDEFDIFDNRAEVVLGGAEFQFDWNTRRRRLLGGYSYVRVYDATEVDDTSESIPKNTGFLMWLERLGINTEFSVAGYYTGSREYQISGNETGPERILQVGLRHREQTRHGVFKSAVTARFQIDDNRDFLSDNVPDDMLVLTLSWEAQ